MLSGKHRSDMSDTDLPHMISWFVERGFPKSILHVNSTLTKGPPSVDARPRYDMLVAVSKKVAADELDGYHVHWSDDPDAPST